MGALSGSGCRIALAAMLSLVTACQTIQGSDEQLTQTQGGPVTRPAPAESPVAPTETAPDASADASGASRPFDPGRGVGMFFVKSVRSFSDSNGQASAHINYGMGVAIHHERGECLILTNIHVVSGGTNNLVSAWTGTPEVAEEHMGRLAWASGDLDAAILAVPLAVDVCAPVKIATDPTRPGERVVAYGQPLPNRGVVTSGRIAGIWNIAALGRTILGDFRSAPGHSGTGIFRYDGSMIGLVTSKARDKEDFVYILPICRIIAEIERYQGLNTSTPSRTGADVSSITTTLAARCPPDSDQGRPGIAAVNVPRVSE